jgi:hypothetical protein
MFNCAKLIGCFFGAANSCPISAANILASNRLRRT